MPVWQPHEGPKTISPATGTVGGAIPGGDLRRRRRRETDNTGAGGGSKEVGESRETRCVRQSGNLDILYEMHGL